VLTIAKDGSIFQEAAVEITNGIKTPATLVEQVAELLQDRCREAAVSYIRSTMAPQLADAAVERYLALDRECCQSSVLSRWSATSLQ
jgi:hypothetical protein